MEAVSNLVCDFFAMKICVLDVLFLFSLRIEYCRIAINVVLSNGKREIKTKQTCFALEANKAHRKLGTMVYMVICRSFVQMFLTLRQLAYINERQRYLHI